MMKDLVFFLKTPSVGKIVVKGKLGSKVIGRGKSGSIKSRLNGGMRDFSRQRMN